MRWALEILRRVTVAELANIRQSINAKQGNKCAICKIPFDAKQVACCDHDHDSGALRGSLCRNCNRSDGKIKTLAVASKRGSTYLEWLKEYVAYLELHQTPQTPYLHPSHKTLREKMDETNKKARLKRAKLKATKAIKNG